MEMVPNFKCKMTKICGGLNVYTSRGCSDPLLHLQHFLVWGQYLTLKAPITTAAEDSLEYFFIFFSDKIMLDISCETSARQRIHMKHQTLFTLKDKSKNNKSVYCNFAWRFKG